MLREHIRWVFSCIKFLEFNPLLNTNEVISDFNVISPFIKDLILGQADYTQTVIENDSFILWKPKIAYKTH